QPTHRGPEHRQAGRVLVHMIADLDLAQAEPETEPRRHTVGGGIPSDDIDEAHVADHAHGENLLAAGIAVIGELKVLAIEDDAVDLRRPGFEQVERVDAPRAKAINLGLSEIVPPHDCLESHMLMRESVQAERDL